MANPDQSAPVEQTKNQTAKSLVTVLSGTLSPASQEKVANLDKRLIAFLDRYSVPLLRYSLAVVFFWFGVLKPLGVSYTIDRKSVV